MTGDRGMISRVVLYPDDIHMAVTLLMEIPA